MSTKRKLLSGPKCNDSHTTIIKDAEGVITSAKAQQEVTKVSPSYVTGVGSTNVRIKFAPVKAGWCITVYGSNGKQLVYVYTRDPERTRAAIQRTWDAAHG